MDICKEYGWKFITVFKDGNLPTAWQEVASLRPLSGGSFTRQQTVIDSTHCIARKYCWIKNIDYKKHCIDWVECVQTSVHLKTGEEKENRFVYLTNFDINDDNVFDILMAGRSRWNIEECFNTLKHRGYALHHKFNRNNFTAIKNWHNARMLAFMINEFVVHSTELIQLKREDNKMTLKELWKCLMGYLTMCNVDKLIVKFNDWSNVRRQVRLE
jgi:hypothetical protein